MITWTCILSTCLRIFVKGMTQLPKKSLTESDVINALRSNYEREVQASQTYQELADKENDPARKAILDRLAKTEEVHAQKWAEKLRSLGVDELPPVKRTLFQRMQLRSSNLTTNLERMEMEEHRNIRSYEDQKSFGDQDITQLLVEIEEDEKKHARSVRTLVQSTDPQNSLQLVWSRERWHKRGGTSWVGDAVYGVNDGLGAVFGIIAGVAGFSASGRFILVSGLAGMIASALSMGAGAYLAAKSNREIVEAEMHHEREEIETDAAHEREELELLYQLKGFTEAEAAQVAERIASDKDLFLRTMAQEELGISEEQFPNPWRSALSGGASTAIGALVPVVPFFFLNGVAAIVTAAIVSIVAHFAVGAAKSLVTVRSWWQSGLEMTIVGIIEGAITYSLGLLGSGLLHG